MHCATLVNGRAWSLRIEMYDRYNASRVTGPRRWSTNRCTAHRGYRRRVHPKPLQPGRGRGDAHQSRWAEFMRFARTSGVETRSLALPLSRYPELTGFTEANEAYVQVAEDLGEQAVRSALEAAHVAPDEVDAIVMVSSTGVAVPTIDARLASRIGLRQDVKRFRCSGWDASPARPGWRASTTTCGASPVTSPSSSPSNCARSHCSGTTHRYPR